MRGVRKQTAMARVSFPGSSVNANLRVQSMLTKGQSLSLFLTSPMSVL